MADKKDAPKKEAAAEGGEEKKSKGSSSKREKPASRWTVDLCMKFAKRFESEAAWAEGAPSSYKAACARGYVADCTKHMKSVAPKRKSA